MPSRRHVVLIKKKKAACTFSKNHFPLYGEINTNTYQSSFINELSQRSIRNSNNKQRTHIHSMGRYRVVAFFSFQSINKFSRYQKINTLTVSNRRERDTSSYLHTLTVPIVTVMNCVTDHHEPNIIHAWVKVGGRLLGILHLDIFLSFFSGGRKLSSFQ